MPILDLQRRGQQIGRIRLGEQRPTGKGDRTRPAKLDTLRFTSQSRHTIDAVAALFGGTVRVWGKEWEVITETSEIRVVVPPRDEVVTQWYEMWSAGGCQRRCDSVTEQRSGQSCLCAPLLAKFTDPDDRAEERARLASLNPPKACGLKTRISVMIPDLPGFGVWRLDTSSYYAGVEILDAAQLMEMAAARKVMLPAILRIDQRSGVTDGQTKKYAVPVLEVLATFREIVSGELEARGIAGQLPPAPGQPKAITAAPADLPRPGDATGRPPLSAMDPQDAAQAMAVEARAAATAEGFLAVQQAAEAEGLLDEYVDPHGEDAWEPLRDYLRDLWREKSRQA